MEIEFHSNKNKKRSTSRFCKITLVRLSDESIQAGISKSVSYFRLVEYPVSFYLLRFCFKGMIGLYSKVAQFKTL